MHELIYTDYLLLLPFSSFADTLYHFGDNDRDAWDRLFSLYKLPPYHIPGLEAVLSFGLAGELLMALSVLVS